MPKILDEVLYQYAKALADEKYIKSSAYKSGYIVNTYKELGGRYEDDNKEKDLKRWFKEKWVDVGNNQSYPMYRPTIRINNNNSISTIV